MRTATARVVLGVFAAVSGLERSLQAADPFGSGANQFDIEFVPVGNPGNGDDAGAGGGAFSSAYGAVDYAYRISTYEISGDMVAKATAGGLANVGEWPPGGIAPARNMSWYEAAAFVNWLNTSSGRPAAYNLTYSGGWSLALWNSADAWQLGGENRYRHRSAYYFLPSEDEWYKAAYHKNDGLTANYWDYPTMDNWPTPPDGVDFPGDTTFDAVIFDSGYGQGGPNAVTNAGSAASAYGAYGQGGNVYEWMESAGDGGNDLAGEDRTVRGGHYDAAELNLRSDQRSVFVPAGELSYLGFRVASVPEPSVFLAILTGGIILLLTRRR